MNDLRQIPAGILKFLNNQQLSDKTCSQIFHIQHQVKRKKACAAQFSPSAKNPSFSVTKDGGKLSISITENDQIDVGVTCI